MHARWSGRTNQLVLAGILCAGCELAAGETFSLNPSADAFVSSANATNNYGAAGAVAVSARGLPKGELQSVLKFDLASAKTDFDAVLGVGNWQVQSVTLQLTAALPNNPIFNNSAAGQMALSWMENDAWTEGTGTPSTPSTAGITWATLPSFQGANDQALGTFSFAGSTSGQVNFSLPLASGLVSDLTAGQIASLRLYAADTAVSGVFNSRSFGTTASRPLLVITATPEPVSALSISAVAILMSLRRRGVRCAVA